ncbi:hypothetical protein K488DRAFT_68925 [Vararia minispora EC-137]|uniref:Uncharacterized protein n=1 Tax=Vararia minispora EC-137 TaxID=1314806 RepID=A0ACB8QT82_9AGAM|nr:hypothetical protein K488DRAFT_68925 [Vararia minispora EC-137]
MSGSHEGDNPVYIWAMPSPLAGQEPRRQMQGGPYMSPQMPVPQQIIPPGPGFPAPYVPQGSPYPPPALAPAYDIQPYPTSLNSTCASPLAPGRPVQQPPVYQPQLGLQMQYSTSGASSIEEPLPQHLNSSLTRAPSRHEVAARASGLVFDV